MCSHLAYSASRAAWVSRTQLSPSVLMAKCCGGLGLLLDTFIIRSLVTPSIATLLGRWFWWPKALPKRLSRKPPTADDAPTAPQPVAVMAAADHAATAPEHD